MEAGTGIAFGWALALICVLPMVVIGGIVIYLTMQPSAWGWLVADVAYLAVLALVEEVAFRGYAFQRFEHAMGGLGAAIGFAAYYAIVQSLARGSDRASIAVSIALGLLLSTAYLRTRALWLSWGLNFGWKASRALLFGLALSGDNSHSRVIQGDPMGPFYKYNAPVLVPGGIPVDLDAAAKRQHEAAMGTADPAAPSLVQIAPVVPTPIPVFGKNGPKSGEVGANDSAAE